MAKPVQVAYEDAAGPSTHTVRTTRPQHDPPRPRRRRQRPLSPSPYFAGPSSGLLSLLATIVASTSLVDGSPTPPSFLCPSIDTEDAPVPSPEPREFQPRQPLPSLHKPTTQRIFARSIPYRYQQDDDGVWRRIDSYTLYGSTVCPSCRDPTSAVTPVNDQMQTSAEADSAATSSTTYDIYDTLPQGWKPIKRPGDAHTTLILALSLVLAFFICFFIIGCLFWRKSIRRKHRESDVEIKVHRRRRSRITPEVEAAEVAEKEAKVKQKIWARATARWKANVRYVARQRRGKRGIVSTMTAPTNQSTNSLVYSQSHERLTIAQSSRSPSRSRTPSRRSSFSSLRDVSSSDTPPTTTLPVDPEPQDGAPPNPLMPPISTAASPPAYRQRILHPASTEELPGHSPSEPPSPYLPPNHPQSRRPSHSSGAPSIGATSSACYSTGVHVAHVATDDKTILARLANMASAPEDGSNSAESSTPEVSVPEWHDEELDGFIDGPSTPRGPPSFSPSHPSNLFPPPPTKGKMAAPDFYDYPFTFEEMGVLGESEPSAPPFEEHSGSSATSNLVPSAPPMLDDDDSCPSALEWDSTPYPDHHAEGDDVNEDANQNGQDHDRQPSEETQRGEPSSSLTSSSLNIHSSPVGGPVSSDGTPPGYRR